MKRYRDLIYCTLVVIFAVVVWWPSRYLPYFWDSSGYIAEAAKTIYDSHFTQIVTDFSDFAHPPLIPVLVALSWQLFGFSPLSAHLLILPFGILFLLAIYGIARKHLKPEYSLLAASLAGFTPVFLAEYANVYMDLPAAALILAALALISYRLELIAYCLFSLALLAKLHVATFFPFLWLLSSKKGKWYSLIPGFMACFWLVYHYQQAGFFLWKAGRITFLPDTVSAAVRLVGFILSQFLFSQSRFLWTGLIAVSLGWFWYKKPKLKALPSKTVLLAYGLTFALTLCFFIITKEFHPRYALALIGLYGIVTAWVLEAIVAPQFNQYVIITISWILLAAVSFSWRLPAPKVPVYEYAAPADLGVYDLALSLRQLAATLQLIGPEAKVYGGFPENLALTKPYQGYVNQPFNFSLCQEFTFDASVLQLIVVHPYSPSQIPCRMIMDRYRLIPVNRFQNHAKWIELYQVDASAGATKKSP